ncbi:MAG: S8 family serine peptidase [Myxococcota bacterium]
MTRYQTGFLRRTIAVTLGALALSACGDDDAMPSEPEDPITPMFGVNAFAYEGIGFDTLLDSGLTGSGVSVCVVDSGIDDTHPAFAHVVERGRLRWADFTDEDSSDPIDTNGHGTHVAGIIAMNDVLTGGAPLVTLLIARVFTADGGTDNGTIADAVDWCRGQDADVISMSLGGLTLPAIEALLAQDASVSEAAVQRALDDGIYVVAAAGNTEVTRDVATPSNVPGVIAVGALNEDLATKAPFSQSGLNDGLVVEAREDPDKKPETSAPGVSITSAMAPDSTIGIDRCDGQLYCALDGTSQATPFVTAALALILEAVPELQADQSSAADPGDNILEMKQALSESAASLPDQTEPHDDGVGYGLVQAPALLDRLQSDSE